MPRRALLDPSRTRREGADFGARRLKRAIEHLLVQPLSTLIATGQIHRGDCVRVSHSHASPYLTFFREADAAEAWEVECAAA